MAVANCMCDYMCDTAYQLNFYFPKLPTSNGPVSPNLPTSRWFLYDLACFPAWQQAIKVRGCEGLCCVPTYTTCVCTSSEAGQHTPLAQQFRSLPSPVEDTLAPPHPLSAVMLHPAAFTLCRRSSWLG
jgi:hypothetical protein